MPLTNNPQASDRVTALLACNQDTLIRIDEDDEARELILELGIDGCFSQLPSPPIDGEMVQTLAYDDNPTHYVFVTLYSGFECATDNGYMVWCLPKSRISADRFAAFVELFHKNHTAQTLASKLVSMKPVGN